MTRSSEEFLVSMDLPIEKASIDRDESWLHTYTPDCSQERMSDDVADNEEIPNYRVLYITDKGVRAMMHVPGIPRIDDAGRLIFDHMTSGMMIAAIQPGVWVGFHYDGPYVRGEERSGV